MRRATEHCEHQASRDGGRGVGSMHVESKGHAMKARLRRRQRSFVRSYTGLQAARTKVCVARARAVAPAIPRNLKGGMAITLLPLESGREDLPLDKNTRGKTTGPRKQKETTDTMLRNMAFVSRSRIRNIASLGGRGDGHKLKTHREGPVDPRHRKGQRNCTRKRKGNRHAEQMREKI